MKRAEISVRGTEAVADVFPSVRGGGSVVADAPVVRSLRVSLMDEIDLVALERRRLSAVDKRWDLVVSVGTDVHPFARLLRWVENWAVSRGVGDRCMVQYGRSTAPEGVECRDFLAREELLETFASARIIVTHGGPGTIIAARGAGVRPIVVPRRHELGEHVDDHQLLFARRMAATDLVLLAEDEEAFCATLDRVLATPGLVTTTPDQGSGVAVSVANFGSIADRLITAAL